MSNEKRGGLEVKRDNLLLAEPEIKTEKPPLYKVMLLNDDYTPMDFVIYVLKTVFHKPHADAVDLMLSIHHHGQALCGVYTRDVAETKVDRVTREARGHEHPLQCIMEKE